MPGGQIQSSSPLGSSSETCLPSVKREGLQAGEEWLCWADGCLSGGRCGLVSAVVRKGNSFLSKAMGQLSLGSQRPEGREVLSKAVLGSWPPDPGPH